MLLFSPKSYRELEEEIFSDAKIGLSYKIQGLAKDLKHPSGYYPNTKSKIIGTGEQKFQMAKDTIVNLQHLDWSWLKVDTTSDQLAQGIYIVNQARMFGIWGLATSKVTEIIERENTIYQEFGYVIGSTQYHILKGEEAFLLRYYHDNQKVEYIIYSYSQPRSLLMKVLVPFIRYKQKEFAKEAIKCLRKKLQ